MPHATCILVVFHKIITKLQCLLENYDFFASKSVKHCNFTDHRYEIHVKS